MGRPRTLFCGRPSSRWRGWHLRASEQTPKVPIDVQPPFGTGPAAAPLPSRFQPALGLTAGRAPRPRPGRASGQRGAPLAGSCVQCWATMPAEATSATLAQVEAALTRLTARSTRAAQDEQT